MLIEKISPSAGKSVGEAAVARQEMDDAIPQCRHLRAHLTEILRELDALGEHFAAIHVDIAIDRLFERCNEVRPAE